MTHESEDFDDSELDEDAVVPANSKIVHYHGNGTSQKILWAFCGFSAIVILGVASFWATTQGRVIEILGELRERMVAVETRLAAVERAVEDE